MKALITEPKDFSDINMKYLRRVCSVKCGPFNRKDLLNAAKETDVLMLRLAHKIDKEFLQSATKLKYILTPTTGLNHIDIDECMSRGIKVFSLKGETKFLESIPSTAEHTWALLMALVRKIPQANEHVKKLGWDRELFKSHNLSGFTLGILGFGRVGKQIAKYAEAFKVPFKFYDIDKYLQEHPACVKSLTKFLQSIDILSIHIPLNENTVNFLNEKNLNFLKKETLIINTSRGEIIDESYIATALIENRIGGYATDVLNDELTEKKRLKSPLLKLQQLDLNLIITPHIAGATFESMMMTESFVIKKFISHLENEH